MDATCLREDGAAQKKKKKKDLVNSKMPNIKLIFLTYRTKVNYKILIYLIVDCPT